MTEPSDGAPLTRRELRERRKQAETAAGPVVATTDSDSGSGGADAERLTAESAAPSASTHPRTATSQKHAGPAPVDDDSILGEANSSTKPAHGSPGLAKASQSQSSQSQSSQPQASQSARSHSDEDVSGVDQGAASTAAPITRRQRRELRLTQGIDVVPTDSGTDGSSANDASSETARAVPSTERSDSSDRTKATPKGSKRLDSSADESRTKPAEKSQERKQSTTAKQAQQSKPAQHSKKAQQSNQAQQSKQAQQSNTDARSQKADTTGSIRVSSNAGTATARATKPSAAEERSAALAANNSAFLSAQDSTRTSDHLDRSSRSADAARSGTSAHTSPGARGAAPAGLTQVDSTGQQSERLPDGTPVAPDAFGRSTAAAPAQVVSEKSVKEVVGTAFDSLLTENAGGSTNSPHALILPTVPSAHGLGSALTENGGVVLSGSIDLPVELSTTGQHPNYFERPELDAAFDGDDDLQTSTDSSPISAARAVSTHASARDLIAPPAPQKNSKLLLALSITAGVLAVSVLGVVIVGLVQGAL